LEMYYADYRQQFLVDQGFYFEVIESLPFMRNEEERKLLMMNDIKEQLALLTQVLQNDEAKLQRDEEGALEEIEEDEDMRQLKKRAKKGTGGLSGFTGGNDPAFE
jgi:hypothetical protein